MDINYRHSVNQKDKPVIKAILESTGVFYPYEIDIAIEIIDTYINQGESSGYTFILAEIDNEVVGYINYGTVPCTVNSWDIYWIAVNKQVMNLGLGTILMKKAEDDIESLGGRHIWVETSSRDDYHSTRQFYLKKQYAVAAELQDFYSEGDNKVIFHKKVG